MDEGVETMDGTVLNVFPNRGFCFVRGDDRHTRFGHVRDFVDALEFDTLREGQGVHFEPFDGEPTERIVDGKVQKNDGKRAVKIKVIK
jgi:cold shock CspA family protein